MKAAVVITGAAGGIGTAICRTVRQEGYLAIGIDTDTSPSADFDRKLDLRNSAALVELGEELARTYALQAIVHCAAVQPVAAAGETGLSDWIDAFRVNVIAVDALLMGTRKNLTANGGSVVVISSVHSRATSGGITAYATTKAAVEGWVRSAALDMGPAVRVNAVAPGAIDTPKLDEGFARWGGEAAEVRKRILIERTALQRIGKPSDVAAAVKFLISREAAFITGTTLVVDGGATARLGSE